MARQFGGDWTRRKLDIVEEYLKAYLIALKNNRNHFRLGYIDAFAGDGSIQLASQGESDKDDLTGLIRGSAHRALALEPGFDAYRFVELDKDAATVLEQGLKNDFPGKDLEVRKDDANKVLIDMCSFNWAQNRAVVFLDPQGAQVEWETMEALAQTEAVDVWIWFPLGVSINRMLSRKGNIPDAWMKRLDKTFGNREWHKVFYQTKTEWTLFGAEEKTEKKVKALEIGEYYVERLKTIFPAVSAKPRVMYNSKRSPIYLLCFAAANPKGGQTALRIANHLLKSL